MGTWGVGIFSNDYGADLREEFRELIAAGGTADSATVHLRQQHGIGSGEDDENDFWLSLAATQHRTGHIASGVIDRALEIIDDPDELERWEPPDRKRRAATLARLKATLQTEPRAPQRLRPRVKAETALRAGQHVLVPVEAGARRILLRITGIQEDKGGRYPVAVALEWDGSDGQLLQAHRLSPMPWWSKSLSVEEDFGFILIGKGGDPTDLHVLTVIGDSATPARSRQRRLVIPWSDLGQFFDAEGRPQMSGPSGPRA